MASSCGAVGVLELRGATMSPGRPVPAGQRGGAELIGEVVQYEDSYRLCYVRGPEGLIVAPAQRLG